MTKSNLPNFNALAKALEKTNAKLHPSQVHGIIAGILCGNPTQDAAWEELITGGKESQQTHELLRELYDETSKELKEFLFEFELILPKDDINLPIKAEALTLWCQGFLTGLKLVHIDLEKSQNPEADEAIKDLIEIAKMNYEDVVDTEEDEVAYTELVEYVRMAVTLLYQDNHEPVERTPS